MGQQTAFENHQNLHCTLNRRAILTKTGFLLAAGAVSKVLADEHTPHTEHAHHHDGGAHTAIIAAVAACGDKGQACLSHCLSLFRAGDTSVADCAWWVEQMLPTCATLSRLLSLESPHIKTYAKICIAVCEDCEKACRQHADQHTACRACGEACAECIKQIKTLLS